jgi:hypothetical protein
VKRCWWRFVSWFKHWTYCSFWGCEPPDDGTWWATSRGMIVITPETKNFCGHCGRDL